jgi:hypothetical protein
MNEPLDPAAARALARKIVVSGEVRFLAHFEERAAERGISPVEAVEAVAWGAVVHVEQRKGTWRYRFETRITATAVLFEDANTMWLLTTYDPRNPETGKRLKE